MNLKKQNMASLPFVYIYILFYKYQLHECEKYDKLLKKIEKNTYIKMKKKNEKKLTSMFVL